MSFGGRRIGSSYNVFKKSTNTYNSNIVKMQILCNAIIMNIFNLPPWWNSKRNEWNHQNIVYLNTNEAGNEWTG